MVGIPQMRDLLRGQMSRLITLAARGVGVKEVKLKRDLSKAHIPADFPDADAKLAAVEYWNKKRRPDLVARIEEISEHFHNHHFVRNASFSHWGMVFKTWYMKEVQRTAPPRDMPSAVVLDLFATVDEAGWLRRLQMYHHGDGETIEPGYWSPMKWGPKPGQEGCKVPAAVLARFSHGRATG